MTLRVISYGGGVQSTALIVLAVQGKLDKIMGGPIDAALFSNVGDDSELPETLDFVRNYAIPYGELNGLPVHELQRIKRDGTPETLMGRLMRTDRRSVDIPVRMQHNGAPGNRNCTKTFKMDVVNKWVKQHGASEDNPAKVAIGISTDEMHRAGNKRAEKWEIPIYPLLELGIDRGMCQKIIADSGLPVPPKSSCFFCPFHRPESFKRLRTENRPLFDKAVALEVHINTVRDAIGKDHVYLTRFGIPLNEAIDHDQPSMFDGPESCDDGYCWT